MSHISEEQREAREKLQQRFAAASQIGGKGSVRRKKKVVSSQVPNDGKAIFECLKRFGLSNLNDVESVTFENRAVKCKQRGLYSDRLNCLAVEGAKMFAKEVVIDCRAHMLGRLAATVAKELLNGQYIVLVRCEATNISGSLFRNKLKFEAFLRLRSNSNPRKASQIHYRAPSKIVWRTIRGMLPHKLPRGKDALSRLKVFEGIPEAYEQKKRLVIPSALKVVCLQTHRRYCRLGDMSSRVGWKHDKLVQRLEATRKVRSSAFFEKKTERLAVYKKAKEAAFAKLSAADQQVLTNAGRHV